MNIDYRISGDCSCFENITIRSGISMTIASTEKRQGSRTERDIEDAPISFGYNLTHRIRCVVRQGDKTRLDIVRPAGNSTVSYLPQSSCTIETPPGERIFGVSFHFSLSALASLLEDVPQCLRDIFSESNASKQTPHFYQQSPMNSESAFIIRQILDCPYKGDIRRLFLEAKSIELVALKLAEMERDNDLVRQTDLSRREMECVREAYQILIDRVDTPFRLDQLSRKVGVNRNKLNHGFKQLYGDTVFNVLRSIRLNQAYMLLLDTELSLSEIALCVGYNNQASFTTAFNRQFGKSPKTVRQDRIGLCADIKKMCRPQKTSFLMHPNMPDPQTGAVTDR